MRYSYPDCPLPVSALQFQVASGAAGKEDVEQILDDLGSLSDPGRMAQTGSERWRWLQPWTWILGVWGNARLQADFVLDVTVRGRGLETCAGVQVCHAS